MTKKDTPGPQKSQHILLYANSGSIDVSAISYFLITVRVCTCEHEHHSLCGMWTSQDITGQPSTPRAPEIKLRPSGLAITAISN